MSKYLGDIGNVYIYIKLSMLNFLKKHLGILEIYISKSNFGGLWNLLNVGTFLYVIIMSYVLFRINLENE